jgi:hypothetical protein
MNIFVLHLDPKKAAEAHADKHVVKMLLEACQLLYTVHWIFAYPALLENKAPIYLAAAQKKLSPPASIVSAPHSKTRPDEPGFRPVHVHHPCAKWVRESLENYTFCAQLAIGLAEEYTFRYSGKTHECEVHARWLLAHPPTGFPTVGQTPFVTAMFNEYKQTDPIESYRAYYRGSKGERGLLQYTRRERPSWLECCQQSL